MPTHQDVRREKKAKLDKARKDIEDQMSPRMKERIEVLILGGQLCLRKKPPTPPAG